MAYVCEDTEISGCGDCEDCEFGLGACERGREEGEVFDLHCGGLVVFVVLALGRKTVECGWSDRNVLGVEVREVKVERNVL